MNKQLFLALLCIGLVMSITFSGIAMADDEIDEVDEIDDQNKIGAQDDDEIDDKNEINTMYETDDDDDEIGDDDDEIDDDDDEIECFEERELEIESDDHLVTVESDFENRTMENEYDIKFSTSGGIRLDPDLVQKSIPQSSTWK